MWQPAGCPEVEGVLISKQWPRSPGSTQLVQHNLVWLQSVSDWWRFENNCFVISKCHHCNQSELVYANKWSWSVLCLFATEAQLVALGCVLVIFITLQTWPYSRRLTADCLISIVIHRSRIEGGIWLRLVADLVPIFYATSSYMVTIAFVVLLSTAMLLCNVAVALPYILSLKWSNVTKCISSFCMTGAEKRENILLLQNLF